MSAPRKYELTDETKSFCGCHLHGIRALVDIPLMGVAAGDLGGWIEREENLSQTGTAWIFGEVLVFDKARVSDNSWVAGNVIISGNAHISDNVRISGNVRIAGNVRISGNVRIPDNTMLFGDARVSRDLLGIRGLPYPVTITDAEMIIGCQCHSLAEWAEFDDLSIIEMDGKKALEFWRAHKDSFLAMARATGRPFISAEASQ